MTQRDVNFCLSQFRSTRGEDGATQRRQRWWRMMQECHWFQCGYYGIVRLPCVDPMVLLGTTIPQLSATKTTIKFSWMKQDERWEMRARARGWGSLFSDGLREASAADSRSSHFSSSRFKVPINFPASLHRWFWRDTSGIGLGTGFNYRHLLRWHHPSIEHFF